MRTRRIPCLALGVAVPAALVMAGAGSASAASGPAATAATTASCNDSWVGPSDSSWSVAANWSTRRVPGATSNVCIDTGLGSPSDIVTLNSSVKVNSLTVGNSGTIEAGGTAAAPVTVAAVTSVTLGAQADAELVNASLAAPAIDVAGGTVSTSGTSGIASPGLVFSNGGSVQPSGGTTTLTGLPQLSGGTLTGVTIDASNGAVVVVPGDITRLVSAAVSLTHNSSIKDTAGGGALAGLTSIDAHSALTDDSPLALTGGLTADGTVSIGSTLTAGQVTVDHGATLRTAVVSTITDTLIGSGTVVGDLVNSGTVDTGAGGAVDGDYTQTAQGTLLAEYVGPKLAVSGTATLAGAFSGGEIEPVAGDRGPVITFGSLSGGFTSHNLGLNLVAGQSEIDQVVTAQVGLSATTVAPGASLTVSGGSFPAESTITVFLDGTTGTPLATFTAGYGGVFSGTVTVPQVAASSHNLVVVGSDGFDPAQQVTTAITVS